MPDVPPDLPPESRVTPTDLGIGRLFNAIRDAVVVSDAVGTIVLWNDGAARTFGWTPAEAEGRNVAFIVPERYRARHHEGMARFAATGHGPLLDTRAAVELPGLHKGGTEIYVELTLAPLEHKGRRYALALLREVTERVRLREALERRSGQLERSNVELARANESLTAFTYVVSHDLKEPVRAIDTYLRILHEDYDAQLPPDAADMLARARASTERLAALLRGLLDLSRVDRGQLQPAALRLRDVLESDPCRVTYEGMVQERAAEVALLDGPAVLAAPSILCQVLSNLVTNAIRHNPSAPPRVRIDAHALPEGMVEVRVDDNGRGFPPELLARFNVSATASDASLGSGFGLLIARRAVERLGGRLWLASSPDLGGARVCFTLPAAG